MGAEFAWHIDAHNRVVVTFHGALTVATVEQLRLALQETIDMLIAQHKRVLVVFDARTLKLSDVPSDVRVAGKRVLALPFDGLAVLAGNRFARAVSYVIRASGQASKIRFFRDKRKAYRWLDNIGRAHKSRSSFLHVIAGLLAAGIGIAALVGWHTGNSYLLRWLPQLRPVNPMGAVGLIVLGAALCALRLRERLWLYIAATGIGLLGLAALLPVPIDHVLYGTKVTLAGPHTQLADSAGICFVALSAALWLFDARRRSLRTLVLVLLVGVLGLSQFIIFGSMYARQFVYGLSDTFVMALNLAVGFTVASLALLIVVLRKQLAVLFGEISRTGWLILAALVFVQVATYGAWAQAVSRNENNASAAFGGSVGDINDALDGRLQAYVDSLYGFRGLFAASSYVEQGEFQAYYNSLNLSATYPGLRALSFISKVKDADLPAFVALHRADKSLYPAGNPTFAITSKTNLPVHYILTYNASSNTVGGTDLGSTPARLQAFRKADQTDAPVSSGTLQFGSTNGQPAQNGFFITIPVSGETSGGSPIGFVNAVFTYQDFFAKTFAHTTLLDGLNVTVSDIKDGSLVFSSLHSGTMHQTYFSNIDVPVADRLWDITVAAPADFGLHTSQSNLPRTMLTGGELFAVLLTVIFVLQARARKEAYQLAENMTEDLEHERTLAVANDQKSQAILASIGDGVFAVDKKERITLFNAAAQNISGFSEGEALRKPYKEILRFEHDGKVSEQFVRKAMAGHLSEMSGDTVLVTKSGKRLKVADSAAPIRDARGNIQGVIVVFRDVSREYELDKAKTEFVSLASHQLRTPLAAINWYGEMLLSNDAGKLNKAQREYAQEIQDGNRRMVELVNALLDVSRLDLGKLTNQPPQPVNIAELVGSLEKELHSSIAEKHLHLGKRLTAGLPPVVADPKLLRMIIQNLLSNAVKYTPAKGEVSIVLRRAAPEEVAAAHLRSDQPHWLFSVKDSGYGIPKEQQGRIFGKLFRADNVQRMNVEGTGLGLYIVKEVAEKLGGRVWFDSVESAGSTFYVVLPFRAKRIAPPPGSSVQ